MNGKLLLKILQREESVAGIEVFLVLPVAALHLAVVPWGIGTDQLVPDSQLSGGFLKKGGL